MKVVCVADSWWSSLTIGKTYEVIGEKTIEDTICYIIINNYDTAWVYGKRYFKLLSEIRNDKIDKLLSEE